MSFSYKPVLLMSILEKTDKNGRVRICDLVSYFINFYENRKEKGLIVEKASSIFQKDSYTEKEVEKNIISNPFKRFADMSFFRRSKDISYIEVNPLIWKKLNEEDKRKIIDVCEKKLNGYYNRIK